MSSENSFLGTKRNGVEQMSGIVTFLPLIAIFGLMYFMMIKPQKKAADEKKKMMESLKKGDAIVTIGGLHGIVDEVVEVDRTVVIDCDGVFLTFERGAIARIKETAAPTPVEVKEEVLVEEPTVVEEVEVIEETPNETK